MSLFLVKKGWCELEATFENDECGFCDKDKGNNNVDKNIDDNVSNGSNNSNVYDDDDDDDDSGKNWNELSWASNPDLCHFDQHVTNS